MMHFSMQKFVIVSDQIYQSFFYELMRWNLGEKNVNIVISSNTELKFRKSSLSEILRLGN